MRKSFAFEVEKVTPLPWDCVSLAGSDTLGSNGELVFAPDTPRQTIDASSVELEPVSVSVIWTFASGVLAIAYQPFWIICSAVTECLGLKVRPALFVSETAVFW